MMQMLADIGWPDVIVALVAAQRVGELILAKRNTAALLAQGAYEVGSGHYPAMVLMHGSWLVLILVMVQFDTPINGALLAVFCLLQALRVWVIASLGPYWTTRIIVVPGAPLISTGPYRFVRHPNYWVVAAEIAVFPLVFGLWQIAIAYSFLNAAVLFVRIRAENQSFTDRSSE